MDGMSGADRTVSSAMIPYQVRRSDRARRVRVSVDLERGVEVVLPRRAAEREAVAAIAELRPWIERRYAELERTRLAVAARGETVPYLGRPLRLIAQPGRIRVHRRGDALLVPTTERRAALERWFRRAARTEIEPRADGACALVGTSYSRLTIRGQRTRWGSCSPAGALSFNWRLLMAPEPVLDYVVWHEVCHLQVMDHSPRFWKLLERCCPGYREQVRWLKRNGATLILT
jgi:predicted metal-dependent hydrolase